VNGPLPAPQHPAPCARPPSAPHWLVVNVTTTPLEGQQTHIHGGLEGMHGALEGMHGGLEGMHSGLEGMHGGLEGLPARRMGRRVR
jgi:hypothetical protein